MTRHRSAMRRAAAMATAATAALVLAACGSDDGSSGGHSGHGGKESPSTSAPASKGKQNAADVTFAQGMIPHHRQAVEMSDLAETRASSEVKSLAAEIKKAQGPEIETLSGWLGSWGEQVPEEMEGMDHSGHDMAGMMSAEEMEKLEKASGKAFDTAFLKMMIEHHEGAVSMAETEKAEGSHPQAISMAESIITSQKAEIERMNTLLESR